MTTRSKAILRAHRVLLRLTGSRLRRMWQPLYSAIARLWAAYLAHGESGATAYVRGSIGRDELLPGLSDVDVVVVLRADEAGPGLAASRATARWQRLRKAFPLTDLLLDYPMIFERDELAGLVNASAYTFGLDAAPPTAAYFGAHVSHDRIRMLERPGLYGASTDWRRIRGRECRPTESARDRQAQRIAAWLELCSWWLWVFPACVDPSGPRTASLCVKLVAEPARIWLWIAHGERSEGRIDALTRALGRLPEEERALRCALQLEATLHRSPAPPLELVLPALVRLSARIARLIEAELATEGSTEVAIAGAAPVELILPHGDQRRDRAPVLPLSDWRTVARPGLLDESFAALTGDPGSPEVLRDATTSTEFGPSPLLRADGLLVLAGIRWRTGLRALKCAATDPVTFALLEGRSEAAFPNVRGWSAHDMAARALAEHRAWLDSTPLGADGEAAGVELAMLLSAARAALFADSLAGGAPALAISVTETVRQLSQRSSAARTVAEHALECYGEFAVCRTPPAVPIRTAMRQLVRDLPPFADERVADAAVTA